MIVVQCHFTQTEDHVVRHTTGWVRLSAGLKVGSQVVLEDEPGVWEVTSVSAPIQEKAIRRRWHNDA